MSEANLKSVLRDFLKKMGRIFCNIALKSLGVIFMNLKYAFLSHYSSLKVAHLVRCLGVPPGPYPHTLMYGLPISLHEVLD